MKKHKPGQRATLQTAEVKTSPRKPTNDLQSKFYLDKIKERFWMTINYLTVPLSSVLIFGVTYFLEYLLFRLVWALLSEDIQQSVSIKLIAEWVQIAIAGMSLIGACIHSGFSLYGTYLVERQFAEKED